MREGRAVDFNVLSASCSKINLDRQTTQTEELEVRCTHVHIDEHAHIFVRIHKTSIYLSAEAFS